MTPLQAAVYFGTLLDKHGVAYALSGSVAGLFYGAERSTVDVDLGIAGEAEAVMRFAHDLDLSEFYVPMDMIADALRLHDSFNVLHNRSPMKLDFFVLGDGVLDSRLLEHRVQFETRHGSVWVSSAVDIAVRKLWWFDKANRSSERQWNDVVALLYGGHVDLGEFAAVAKTIGLEDLARLALRDAGVS